MAELIFLFNQLRRKDGFPLELKPLQRCLSNHGMDFSEEQDLPEMYQKFINILDANMPQTDGGSIKNLFTVVLRRKVGSTFYCFSVVKAMHLITV